MGDYWLKVSIKTKKYDNMEYRSLHYTRFSIECRPDRVISYAPISSDIYELCLVSNDGTTIKLEMPCCQ